MINDVFSIATLVLAFFAGMVALLAYQASTGLPKLRLRINFDNQGDAYNDQKHPYKFKWKNTAERWAELEAWFIGTTRPPKLEEGSRPWTKTAYIWIDNKSKYSARNPAVIVRFGTDDSSPIGLCKEESWKLGEEKDLPWKDIELMASGRVALATQWDGEYPIHGHSTRRLPDLPLATLYGKDPGKFYIELLADGYRKVQKITMNFIGQPETEQQQAIHQRGKGGLGESGNGSGT